MKERKERKELQAQIQANGGKQRRNHRSEILQALKYQANQLPANFEKNKQL